jgi:hypothetical protein
LATVLLKHAAKLLILAPPSFVCCSWMQFAGHNNASPTSSIQPR